MPEQITATFQIVTPMFLGGASSDELADTIRPPSVKGALRFWWRALQWGRIRASKNSDNAALAVLHSREAQLFGLAAGEKTGGQGKFMLSTSFKPTRNIVTNWPPGRQTGSDYLGLGLFEMNEIQQRRAFEEGQTFDLTLRFRPRTTQNDILSVREALHAFGLLGGLGGRGQRRGFGSIAMTAINGTPTLPNDKDDYVKAIQGLISTIPAPDQTPPFSTIHASTRVVIVASGHQARSVHNDVGNIFKAFRGRAGPYRGHQKIPLGLPLQLISDDRRASPLCFHIHSLADAYIGIALFFDAEFHPKYTNTNYQIIENFMVDKEPINT